MKITHSEKDGICLIALEGRLVGGPEAVKLKQVVRDNLGQGFREFMIDMSQVEWLNATGLGVLISCLKVIRDEEGSMALCGVSARVLSLLTITKLMSVFERFDTQREAEDFLRQRMATK